MAGKKSTLTFSPAPLDREISVVLDGLTQQLTADFGKGCTTTNLKYMRSSYLVFPIRHALRDESVAAENVNALRSELPDPDKRAAPRLELPIHHKTGDESPLPRSEPSWVPCPLRLHAERGRM